MAWGCEQRLVLGQIATDAKSNEITAVPKLLDLLMLTGTIITVDAMNCQRDTARAIIDKGGDYAFALKGNQGTLHDDVRRFLDDPDTAGLERHTTVDGDHGRIETRNAVASTDIAWLQEIHHWPGLEAIGKVIRTREMNGKVTTETAYYLLSTPLSAERFTDVVRAHWGIENSLHWVLDVRHERGLRPQPQGQRPQKTWPSSVTWPSTSSARKTPRDQCASSSSEPDGTTISSPGS